ncbi:LPXTG cell wall anchor domain-containing protein [Streptomyces sp. NPDC052013]|uniref:LPXTG cell wall anchor domain-containing protein n=1 Tax=Streptomyces sp. NPDC052013 TaxID=3365679 RepID=UPI0037D75A54
MSSAVRPLLTATAAGTLLCALWFVPSANATSDSAARESATATPSPQVTEQARAASASLDGTGEDVRLADTGSFDSTPYILAGTACLALGAGFVTYSVRRERLGP